MAEHSRVDVVPVESNLAKAVKEEQAKDKHEASQAHTEHEHHTSHTTPHSTEDDLHDRIKKGNLTDEDKKKLGATAGAVIAFIAALAFGGYKYHQHRQHKKEEEELEAKAGAYKEKGAKLGGWFGKKAHQAKDAAIDAKDVVTDKAGDAAHRVGDGLKGAADKVKEEGHDTEKALMKGSEKSDHVVRSTYDKAADTVDHVKGKALGKADHVKGKASENADYVKGKAHHASRHVRDEKHGLWHNTKSWFVDRKDELDEAAAIGRKEQRYVADKAKSKAHQITN